MKLKLTNVQSIPCVHCNMGITEKRLFATRPGRVEIYGQVNGTSDGGAEELRKTHFSATTTMPGMHKCLTTLRLTREALSSASSSTSSSSDLRSSSSSSSLNVGGSSSTILDFLRDTPFALPLDCRLADITPTRMTTTSR